MDDDDTLGWVSLEERRRLQQKESRRSAWIAITYLVVLCGLLWAGEIYAPRLTHFIVGPGGAAGGMARE